MNDVVRAAGIVAKMTVADKVALACADFAAVAHLGLPPLSFTDGGNGVRVADDATAFPVCLSLAAAFDEQLAYRFGSAVGREARSAGHNVLLSVGYRFFAATGQQPLFPFGHGLSYARFGYESLEVRRTGPGDIQLSFDIVNDSPRRGHEVAQLYLRCPEAAAEPPLQLKGFTRVHLGAGERRAVRFTLTGADLAAWSDPDGWTVRPGRYEVLIGSSSADVRLSASVEVTNRGEAVHD
jgi:hypothetical protein